MRGTTLSLNSEPKYYPVEVLLKNQSQELPEDVNPAKKEVSGCIWRTWSSPWVKHLLSIQPRTDLEHCKALNRHLNHPGAQAENPGLLLASFFSPPTSIHQLASIHCSPSLCCQYGPAIWTTAIGPQLVSTPALQSVPHITTNGLLQQMILFYLKHPEWLPTTLRIQSSSDGLQGPKRSGPCPPLISPHRPLPSSLPALQLGAVFPFLEQEPLCLLLLLPENTFLPDHQTTSSSSLFRSQLQCHLPRKASLTTYSPFILGHRLSAPLQWYPQEQGPCLFCSRPRSQLFSI